MSDENVCQGKTAKGDPCKLAATEGEFCHHHQPETPPTEEVVDNPMLSNLPDIVKAEIAKESSISDNVLALMDEISAIKSMDKMRRVRKGIRYRIFRIRDGGRIGEQHDKGLKDYFLSKLPPHCSINDFTFTWDVAPDNPLKIILSDMTNYEWLDMGGKFDKYDKYFPPAFTGQR